MKLITKDSIPPGYTIVYHTLLILFQCRNRLQLINGEKLTYGGKYSDVHSNRVDSVGYYPRLGFPG